MAINFIVLYMFLFTYIKQDMKYPVFLDLRTKYIIEHTTGKEKMVRYLQLLVGFQL